MKTFKRIQRSDERGVDWFDEREAWEIEAERIRAARELAAVLNVPWSDEIALLRAAIAKTREYLDLLGAAAQTVKDAEDRLKGHAVLVEMERHHRQRADTLQTEVTRLKDDVDRLRKEHRELENALDRAGSAKHDDGANALQHVLPPMDSSDERQVQEYLRFLDAQRRQHERARRAV